MRSSSFGQTAARRGIQSRKLAPRLFAMQHLTASKALAPNFDQLRLAPLDPKNMGCTLLDWVRRDSANSNGFEEEQNDEGSRSCPPLNSVQTAMIGPKLESSSIVSKLMRFMPVSNERILVFFPHPINPRLSLVPYFESSVLIPSFPLSPELERFSLRLTQFSLELLQCPLGFNWMRDGCRGSN